MKYSDNNIKVEIQKKGDTTVVTVNSNDRLEVLTHGNTVAVQNIKYNGDINT